MIVTLDEIKSSKYVLKQETSMHWQSCTLVSQEQTNWKDVYRMHSYTQAANRRLHMTRPPQKRCQEDQNITTKRGEPPLKQPTKCNAFEHQDSGSQS
jgi:hypothetical protein